MFTKLALDVIPQDDLRVDWEHVYLLGWTCPDGHQYLTTWMDGPDTLYIRVVVTGPVLPSGPLMWDAPGQYKGQSCPTGAFTLHLVGHGEDSGEIARRLGGVRALGWYFRGGFQRGWHLPGCQKLHPLGETPCWGTP